MASAASFFDLAAEKPNGTKINFADYQGKGNVFLIVNTATHCGFTPQFNGLEELHQKFKDQGLVVLGFPCDQFGSQNKEDDAETETFCQRNHGVTFPLLKKSDVNGDAANDVFKFLKKEAKGIMGERIVWNFTKFLVSSDGKVLHRYAPITKPDAISADVEKALKAAKA